MFLEIFVILIIALAGFMHFRSGIWSAVQTLWAVLLAGLVAFGLFIPLSQAIFPAGDPQTETVPYWADALTLLLLFVITFGAIRLLSERLLRSPMTFQPLADTIGGAVLGVLGGYIIGGVFAVFAQMMPLPPDNVFGYQPFELSTGARKGHMATKADETVLGIYNGVLGGSLAGGEGNLASHYPAATPSATGQVTPGSTVDDILHYYFRRRLQYAITVSDGLKAFKGSKTTGVAVTAGTKETYAPRGGVPVAMEIHGVRKLPYRAWRKALKEVSTDKAWELQWPMTDGTYIEVSRPNEQKCAVMLVDVSFKPGEDQAISLGDWSVTHDFRTGSAKPSGDEDTKSKRRSKKKAAGPMPRAKLWGLGKTGSDAGAIIVPVEAAKSDADESAALDAASIEIEAYRKGKSLGKGADAEYLASSAVWNFVGDLPRARATLAFLVPAMSRPSQFGLKCGGVATESASSKSRNPDGLYEGRKMESGPLKFTVKEVSWTPSHDVITGVGKNNELVVLELDISTSSKDAMLFSSDDLTLQNTTIKKDYSARLIEAIVTVKGKTDVKRSVNNGDIKVTDGKRIMDAAGTTGQQVAEDWEIFFVAGKSSKATVRLAFELPRGRRADGYSLGVAEDLPDSTPDWYLMRNVAKIASKTHLVDIEDTMSAESIKVDVGNGRILERKAGLAGGQQIFVIVVSVTPKSDDDMKYYEVMPMEVTLKANHGPSKGREVPLFAFRAEDDKTFRQPTSLGEYKLVIRGSKELEFAYYLPKEHEDLQFRLMNFGWLKLSDYE